MQIIIDIPDEQVKKSLEESKYNNEDEGEKGSVHIAMLFTDAQLEFVDVERKTDFYSCEYKILPKGHGRIKDIDKVEQLLDLEKPDNAIAKALKNIMESVPTIIEADTAESEVQK